MDDADISSEPPGRTPGSARPAVIDLMDETGALAPRDESLLREFVDKAVAHLGCTGEVRVRLVADGTMTEAHQRWSGVAETTDVLTFDLGTEGRTLDADLLVCVDEAHRQASARGHPAWQELLLYIVHGVLHCLGHDDAEEARSADMHRIEDETLEAIGVGRIYAVASARGDRQT